jgi:hypothetical protein
VPIAAWHTHSVDYIVRRGDAVLPETTPRWFAARAAATVHDLPGDHAPFVSRPQALADLLVDIVERQTSTR